MTVVLIVGLLMNAIALPIAAKRILFLYNLISSGQPAPDRIENVRGNVAGAIKAEVVKVFGQKKLLQWSIPGAAHAFVMYAFFILATVYLEAYGILLSRNPEWSIPIIGDWAILGFAQDFIGVMCVLSLVVFAIIRLKNAPGKLGRQSRFKGSHNGGAWLVLFMIFNVIWTMFLFRGASSAAGNFPYENGAFASIGVGNLLDGLSEGTIETIEHVGLLLHIGIMLIFLIQVLNSKHLHIFLAPINVLFGRQPIALGALKPLMINGKPLDPEGMEDLEEEDFEKLGIGKVEDFSWKGILDFATCTECGRCQSQCPAWATEKPLSPKLLIMDLRDHGFAKAPYILADDDATRANLPSTVLAEADRPLIGDESSYGVIDPDVLWACTNCGACVEQCPVDIEHVDHIDDMRRYQVLVESNFPAELNQLFKGLERKGNPWNMDPKGRMDWAKDLDFEVKQVGKDIEDLESVDWLFWVGCAGAYEDRAKKTTQAVAELLNMAGVTFGVLGDGETCTGDPARRAGNEVVFQQLAMQNAEVFKETKVKKVVSTCAHCFNALKNEYAEFGVELEVVHHTQLLNRLVREGRLTPIAPTAGEVNGKTITYHDPCFLGRHNKVYEPPRELLNVIPGATFKEMPRNSEMSFCCGAGGARMWMEETIGSRINVNRTEEAVATGADQIAVGCPFCRVMLDDGLTLQQSEGKAREEVEVLDVAQMLLAGVQRGTIPEREPAMATAAPVTGESPSGTGESPSRTGESPSRTGESPSRTGESPSGTGESLSPTQGDDSGEPKAKDNTPTEAAPASGAKKIAFGKKSELTEEKQGDSPAGSPIEEAASDSNTGEPAQSAAKPAESETQKPAAGKISFGKKSDLDKPAAAEKEPDDNATEPGSASKSDEPKPAESQTDEPKSDEPKSDDTASEPAEAAAKPAAGKISFGKKSELDKPVAAEPAQTAPTAEEPKATEPEAKESEAPKPAGKISFGKKSELGGGASPEATDNES